MEKLILIVEDNKTIALFQSHKLKGKGFKCLVAHNFLETRKLYDLHKDSIVMAVVDINLPDCGTCALDYLITKNIPSIAMTGSFHIELRDKILKKAVIDYVVVDNDPNLESLVSLVGRILHNHHTKVLIVDDSKTSRLKLREFLEYQNFTILEAVDADEALKLIRKNNDIKIAFIDYEMPKMNGVELAKKIRKKFSRMEMAIFAISVHTNPLITVEFLKAGANDFITKPYVREEVNAGVAVNLDMISLYKEAKHEKEERISIQKRLKDLTSNS